MGIEQETVEVNDGHKAYARLVLGDYFARIRQGLSHRHALQEVYELWLNIGSGAEGSGWFHEQLKHAKSKKKTR